MTTVWFNCMVQQNFHFSTQAQSEIRLCNRAKFRKFRKQLIIREKTEAKPWLGCLPVPSKKEPERSSGKDKRHNSHLYIESNLRRLSYYLKKNMCSEKNIYIPVDTYIYPMP